MISSRCKDKVCRADGSEICLTDLRSELKTKIMETKLFDREIFDVWINEDESSSGEQPSDEECLRQVRDADIVLVLYNGNSGWANRNGDIGICHAELQDAWNLSPAKTYMIKIPFPDFPADPDLERHQRFQKYVEEQNRFRPSACDAEEIVKKTLDILRRATVEMAKRGAKDGRRGRFYTGSALDWARMSYLKRQEHMINSASGHLEQNGSTRDGNRVAVPFEDTKVLVVCHAIPDSLTISAARELVGQPFLDDYTLMKHLSSDQIGPVHLILCHKGVTEAQAVRQLGFPDATRVSAPFGIYVADDIQKIQLCFIADCRDDGTTRRGIQRWLDWLEQTGEVSNLIQRARHRKEIVCVVSKYANTP
jgi:hypothetical protein